jgi:signal peptidase II
MARWLWLSFLVVLFDQVTKQMVERSLALRESVELLPFLDLTLLYNEGAAFSFLSDQGGWQRWFLVLLALLVTLVLINWVWRLGREERRIAAALSLIIGGAVGNLVDRALFGYVIDFIDLYYGQWHWPAFNIADSAIVIGVAFMLVDVLLGSRRQHDS